MEEPTQHSAARTLSLDAVDILIQSSQQEEADPAPSAWGPGPPMGETAIPARANARWVSLESEPVPSSQDEPQVVKWFLLLQKAPFSQWSAHQAPSPGKKHTVTRAHL